MEQLTDSSKSVAVLVTAGSSDIEVTPGNNVLGPALALAAEAQLQIHGSVIIYIFVFRPSLLALLLREEQMAGESTVPVACSCYVVSQNMQVRASVPYCELGCGYMCGGAGVDAAFAEGVISHCAR